MVWVLKHFGQHDIDDFVLYALDNNPNNRELSRYFKERFSLLDSKQMRACALFLQAQLRCK
jgi:hypothetical protein